MSFSEAVRTVLSKYTDFSGRARRSEYWYWSLAMFLTFFVVGMIMVTSSTLGTLLEVVLLLAVLLPSLAVTVRRLHDTGRSGWMCLISLVPLVGGLVLLVFTVSDSTPGPNRYGPAPKALGAGALGYGYGT